MSLYSTPPKKKMSKFSYKLSTAQYTRNKRLYDRTRAEDAPQLPTELAKVPAPPPLKLTEMRDMVRNMYGADAEWEGDRYVSPEGTIRDFDPPLACCTPNEYDFLRDAAKYIFSENVPAFDMRESTAIAILAYQILSVAEPNTTRQIYNTKMVARTLAPDGIAEHADPGSVDKVFRAVNALTMSDKKGWMSTLRRSMLMLTGGGARRARAPIDRSRLDEQRRWMGGRAAAYGARRRGGSRRSRSGIRRRCSAARWSARRPSALRRRSRR